jgi:hypothetical protein
MQRTYLLNHHVDCIFVIHFELMSLVTEQSGNAYALRSVCGTNALSVVKETQSIQRFPLSLGIGVHQLVEWRCSLDFEEDFIVVLERPPCQHAILRFR